MRAINRLKGTDITAGQVRAFEATELMRLWKQTVRIRPASGMGFLTAEALKVMFAIENL